MSRIHHMTDMVKARVKTLIAAAAAAFAAGCDSGNDGSRQMQREILALPYFALELSKAEEQPFALSPNTRTYTNLFAHILGMDDIAARSNILSSCETAILDFRLDRRAYLSRLRSLQVFSDMTAEFAMLLYAANGNGPQLWDFKNKAMQRIRLEIDAFKSEPTDLYPVAVLASYSRQQYERALKIVGNDMMLAAFSGHWANPAREYYGSLKPEEQKEWMAEIERSFGQKPDFATLDFGATPSQRGQSDVVHERKRTREARLQRTSRINAVNSAVTRTTNDVTTLNGAVAQ